MFQWFDILLITAFGLGFYQYHVHIRRRILYIRLGVLFFYSLYFYFYGAMAGAIVSGISFFAVLTQITLPEPQEQKKLPLRHIVACCFAVIGVFAAYESHSDLLPLMGIIIARFSEAQNHPQHMRYGFIGSILCWIFYSFDQEMWMALIADIILLFSNFWAIQRFSSILKQAETN